MSADNAYRKALDESGIFSNTCDTACSQGKVAELVRAHFANDNGKKKSYNYGI